MSLIDEAKRRLAAVLDRVRSSNDIRTGLETALVGKDTEIKTLREQLEAGQTQPGPWTEADVQGIIDQLKTIEDTLPATEVVDAVVENTPVADGGGGSGEAG